MNSSLLKQQCNYWHFWHVWLIQVLWSIQKQFFYPPKRNSRYMGATATNFIQSVLNRCLRRLKMSSAFFFVSYLMIHNFLKRKKKSNEKIKRWYPPKMQKKASSKTGVSLKFNLFSSLKKPIWAAFFLRWLQQGAKQSRSHSIFAF